MKYIILTYISLISFLSFSIEAEKENNLLGWNALKGNETFGMGGHLARLLLLSTR